MQMSQRSPQRRAAQAQAAAEPWCAGAGGRRQVPLRRRVARFSGQTLPRRKINLLRAAATGSGREEAAKTSPVHTCWLSWIYLCSRSLLITPGAVRGAEGGRGELAPARLRPYGGRKGPEVILLVTVASPTLSPHVAAKTG